MAIRKAKTETASEPSKTALTEAESGSQPIQYQLTRSYVGKSLEYVSEAEFNQQKEETAGFKRCAQLVAQEWELKGEIAKAEQSRLGYEIEATKVLDKSEVLRQTQLKYQQQQTKTKIEGVNLSELQRDLSGRQSEATLRSDIWDLKIEGIESDVATARSLLAVKKQNLDAKRA